MGLETDAVDFYPAGLEGGDEGLRGGGFGAGVFDVVVVIVEFYVGIVLRCDFEGDWNVFGADLIEISMDCVGIEI